ncbi:hypothetical protein GGR52DRAFT_522583 [Hypoxylon sp. FL1284]|nr:hypothetical protein GGR52DRAFT_522583 [Hypoxylon sp. FL1284]
MLTRSAARSAATSDSTVQSPGHMREEFGEPQPLFPRKVLPPLDFRLPDNGLWRLVLNNCPCGGDQKRCINLNAVSFARMAQRNLGRYDSLIDRQVSGCACALYIPILIPGTTFWDYWAKLSKDARTSTSQCGNFPGTAFALQRKHVYLTCPNLADRVFRLPTAKAALLDTLTNPADELDDLEGSHTCHTGCNDRRCLCLEDGLANRSRTSCQQTARRGLTGPTPMLVPRFCREQHGSPQACDMWRASQTIAELVLLDFAAAYQCSIADLPPYALGSPPSERTTLLPLTFSRWLQQDDGWVQQGTYTIPSYQYDLFARGMQIPFVVSNCSIPFGAPPRFPVVASPPAATRPTDTSSPRHDLQYPPGAVVLPQLLGLRNATSLRSWIEPYPSGIDARSAAALRLDSGATSFVRDDECHLRMLHYLENGGSLHGYGMDVEHQVDLRGNGNPALPAGATESKTCPFLGTQKWWAQGGRLVLDASLPYRSQGFWFYRAIRGCLVQRQPLDLIRHIAAHHYDCRHCRWIAIADVARSPSARLEIEHELRGRKRPEASQGFAAEIEAQIPNMLRGRCSPRVARPLLQTRWRSDMMAQK